jgi:O-antigen ligase
MIRRALLLAGLLAVLALGIAWVGGDRLAGRFDDSAAVTNGEPRINASRSDIWRASLRLAKDHPVVGVGFGGYWIAIAHYNDASGKVAAQEAHNDYLELFASGGLIGLAVAAWAAVVLFRQVRRCLRDSRGRRRAICVGALAGLFAIGVHSLVDFGLHVTVNALACAALIVLACREVPVTKSGSRSPLDEWRDTEAGRHA